MSSTVDSIASETTRELESTTQAQPVADHELDDDLELDDDDVPDLLPVSKVPITLVTGFLGAGKTTFLKHVLHEKHGMRIAVIVNDFGQVGIEKMSVVNEQGSPYDDWIELSNGCICCSVRGDLAMALEGLVDKKGLFDNIIIEATGLADPSPLVRQFWFDDGLMSDLYLDGVITFVSAKHIGRQLDTTGFKEASEDSAGKSAKAAIHRDTGVNEAHQQVALADRLIINKVDLVTEEEIAAIRARLAEINPTAKVFLTEYSRVALDEVLDIHAFDFDHAFDVFPQLKESGDDVGAEKSKQETEKHLHEHSHDAESCSQCQEAQAQTSQTIDIDSSTHTGLKAQNISAHGVVDIDGLRKWLGLLLWEKGAADDMYRYKGLMHGWLDDDDLEAKELTGKVMGTHVLQGVHELFDVQFTGLVDTTQDDSNEDYHNRFLFIGRNLERWDIEKGILQFVSSPEQ